MDCDVLGTKQKEILLVNDVNMTGAVLAQKFWAGGIDCPISPYELHIGLHFSS